VRGKTLFVGLGSHHGDDRVGWLVVDELRVAGLTGVEVRRLESPLDLLDWLEDVDCLAICDACQGAGVAGTWHRWTWPSPELPLMPARGSHDMGLVATLQLARTLGTLPREVLIWGIELAVNEAGGRVSNEVVAAIESVARDVAGALGAGDQSDSWNAHSSSEPQCTNRL